LTTYLALGDSYTIGEAVPEGARWPVQLAAALRARGIALADPRIVATTGWTTDELAAAMDAADLAPVAGSVGGPHADVAAAGEGETFGFVSLLIGVNNQYRGRAVGEYAVEFAELLQRAIRLAGGRAGRVLVLSIPDWGVTPFGRGSGRDLAQVADELDAYNAAAAAECARRGVAFVDITPVSRARGAELVADDGLHPSEAMYAEWTALALPVAGRILKP